MDELPYVLWTYHTTPQRSTGDTLFLMTYGSEVVIPLKTGFPMLRTSQFSVEENNHLLSTSLDLVDERREVAMVKMAHYQQKLKQGYDRGVKVRSPALGDLVLRKVVGTVKNPSWGKLGPNWEGLYRITLIASIGAYYLEDLDENVVPSLWNVNNLRRYYY